jgi:hypothetical protein
MTMNAMKNNIIIYITITIIKMIQTMGTGVEFVYQHEVFFPYPPFLFFVCNNKKEIQHHCEEQRKEYIRNEQNEQEKM